MKKELNENINGVPIAIQSNSCVSQNPEHQSNRCLLVTVDAQQTRLFNFVAITIGITWIIIGIGLHSVTTATTGARTATVQPHGFSAADAIAAITIL